jgi:glutaredoxin
MSSTSSFAPRPAQNVNAAIGTLCLVGGVALVAAVILTRVESLADLPELPTRLIRRNPVLMMGFAVALILAGARLLWQVRQMHTLWAPSRPGRRFDSLVLYTKPGCLLCDEAAAVLEAYRPYLPEMRTVDITDNPELQSRYGTCIPVVEIDGRRRFTGQINEVLLRRLIEGTPPRPTRS